MDFGVLGPLEFRRDGVHVRIGSRMQRRLLALLLVHAGAWVRAEQVIDVLWEGEPPPSASTAGSSKGPRATPLRRCEPATAAPVYGADDRALATIADLLEEQHLTLRDHRGDGGPRGGRARRRSASSG